MGWIVAYCRNCKKGEVVTRFTLQHPTEYQYKRSAVTYARRNYNILRKPVVILKQLDDQRWLVDEVIE